MKTQKTTHKMKRNFIWLLTSLMLIGLLGIAHMSLAAGGVWTKKSDMPMARCALSASVVDGIIYAIGGLDNAFWGLSTVEMYDSSTDTWTKKKSDMPTARGFLSTSAVKGKIYAIGGGTGGGDAPPLKEGVVEEYETGFVPKGVDAKGKLPTTWGRIKRSR